MKHFATPLAKARGWLERLDRVNDPWLVSEIAHHVVHNGVVALRNLRSGDRGKIGHDRVAPVAARLGLPPGLVEAIGAIEQHHATFVYGAGLPTPEMARRYRDAARKLMSAVEAQAKERKP